MDKYVYRPKVKMSDGTFKDAFINAECIDGLPNIPNEINNNTNEILNELSDIEFVSTPSIVDDDVKEEKSSLYVS